MELLSFPSSRTHHPVGRADIRLVNHTTPALRATLARCDAAHRAFAGSDASSCILRNPGSLS
jgi:hypothetical protein